MFRNTIIKLRTSTPAAKKRFTMLVSVVITLMVAVIAGLTMMWDLSKRQELYSQSNNPIQVGRQSAVEEIKKNIEHLKGQTSASVGGLR